MTANELYKKIKRGPVYQEAKHCKRVIEIFQSGGTLSDFLVETGISRQRLVAWQQQYPVFKECLLVAKEIGRMRWLKEGELNADNREFSVKRWEIFGRQNFGNLDKIALSIDGDGTPYQQYQQVLAQAACGDFTSSEIKQIMESINIGIRAHEVCILQEQLDELKEGLAKMEERELEHQIADLSAEEEDSVAVEGGNGDHLCAKGAT